MCKVFYVGINYFNCSWLSQRKLNNILRGTKKKIVLYFLILNRNENKIQNFLFHFELCNLI